MASNSTKDSALLKESVLVVRGHNVYKNAWTPRVREIFRSDKKREIHTTRYEQLRCCRTKQLWVITQCARALTKEGLKAGNVYALNKGYALNNGVRLTTRVYGITSVY